MTIDQGVEAIIAKMADSTPPSVDRAKKTIPLGVAQFCAEHQWEFLDMVATCPIALESSTGFYKITRPSKFFKPVVLSHAKCPEMDYIDRIEFMRRFHTATAAVSPDAFTIIGEDMYVPSPAAGDTIHVIYTRLADVGFADIPAQYQFASILATVKHLLPSVLHRTGGDVVNPAYAQANEDYKDALNSARGLEAENKARTNRQQPSRMMVERGRFR